jgi:hypothetical protein
MRGTFHYVAGHGVDLKLVVSNLPTAPTSAASAGAASAKSDAALSFELFIGTLFLFFVAIPDLIHSCVSSSDRTRRRTARLAGRDFAQWTSDCERGIVLRVLYGSAGSVHRLFTSKKADPSHRLIAAGGPSKTRTTFGA